MTIEEARTLIRGVEWRGSRPGLSRVRELLHRIGDPQDTLQFVHIAGTNGKGSTAAMLAAVLQAAGYTTGLFTSPFLEQFAERMQVNGQPIPDAELAAACETLQPCIAAMDDQPTEFELVTAAAMLWFQRRGCDIVVLEVGLGGRLDATNVIGAPACAVITNIGDAHQENFINLEQKCDEKMILARSASKIIYHSYYEPLGRMVAAHFADRRPVDAAAYPEVPESVIGNAASRRNAQIVEAFCDAMHYPAPSFAAAPSVAMRLEVKEGINDSILINDAYNLDLNSLALALDYLHSVALSRRRTLVLSDICLLYTSPSPRDCS